MAYIKKADRLIKTQAIQTEQAENVSQVVATPEAERQTPPKKVRVTRDWSVKDNLRTPEAAKKKNPGMHFYWCLRTVDEMEKFEEQGYEYVHLSPEERPLKRPAIDGTANASFVTRGDLILMMIPEEDYADKVKYESDSVKKRLAFITGKGQAKDIRGDRNAEVEIKSKTEVMDTL
jgi:uncharacterized protein (DUF952 family)